MLPVQHHKTNKFSSVNIVAHLPAKEQYIFYLGVSRVNWIYINQITRNMTWNEMSVRGVNRQSFANVFDDQL